MSKLDHMLEPDPTAVRRLEVITGTGRRRRFSEDDKARVIEETLIPGAVVSEVARRHGLTPQQVFTWRRQARQPTPGSADRELTRFVPAVVAPPLPKPPVRRRNRRPWLGIRYCGSWHPLSGVALPWVQNFLNGRKVPKRSERVEQSQMLAV